MTPELWLGLGLAHLAIASVVSVWILALAAPADWTVRSLLLVLSLPGVGFMAFLLISYPRGVLRPRRLAAYRRRWRGTLQDPWTQATNEPMDPLWEQLACTMQAAGAFPVRAGHTLRLHADTTAWERLQDHWQAAEQTIDLRLSHLPANQSALRLETLQAAVQRGVVVRVLVEAGPLLRAWRALRRQARRARGDVKRSQLQSTINHQCLYITTIIDRKLALTGSLGAIPSESMLLVQLAGPAAADIERLFAEEWHYPRMAGSDSVGELGPTAASGRARVQVIGAGPGRGLASSLEAQLAAVQRARHRIWLLQADFSLTPELRLGLLRAARQGREVRLLLPLHAQCWLEPLAQQFHWNELLRAGVNLQQVQGPLPLGRILLVDDHLSLIIGVSGRQYTEQSPAGLAIYADTLVEELEQWLEQHVVAGIQLDPQVYARRPLTLRIAESAARLSRAG